MQYASQPAFFPGAITWLDGTLTPTPLGVGVKKPNGKFLSVQPDGSYDERDAVLGVYEQFTVDEKVNVLHVNPGIPYAIAYHG